MEVTSEAGSMGESKVVSFKLWKTNDTASSCEEGKGPEKAADENVQTWWRAASEKPGEWLQIDLGKNYDVAKPGRRSTLQMIRLAFRFQGKLKEHRHSQDISKSRIM